jgi:tetratricopeptide (TPR) repeat protein
MFHLYLHSLRSTCLLTIALVLAPVFPTAKAAAQTPANKSANGGSTLPQPSKQASSPKATAYYHYSLGHLYEELAGSSGNRSDYVNKAIDNYRLAMKEDASASFLVEEIAELYRVSGRIREAVEEAQDALKTNPDDLNARRVLARIYTQQIGDAQTNHVDESMARRAVDEYKRITEKDPKDVDSLVMLGRLNKLLDNSVDAESAFKKVLAVDADNEDAITGLAGVYSDRGDARGASELLRKLTDKSPSPRALVVLANNYEQMRQYGLAADAYKKALTLDPNRPELKSALAQDQALSGKFADALKTYQELADANPRDSQPYLGMSQIYREQKDLGLARKMNDKAKELDAENLEVRYNEVALLQDEGRTNEAIAKLKGILDSTTRRTYDLSQRANRAKMLEQLGFLYRNSDQYDEAVDAYRQIVVLDAQFAPRAEAQIIDTYRAAKDYPKAQQESDAALKKFPNDHTVRAVHAQLLADQGKADVAIAELKQSLNGKNDRETYIAMAEVFEKSHNYSEMSKALDAAEKLSQDKGDKATILFMRGSMYEREKKYDQAEKMFRQVLETDPANASALNYLGYMLADQNVRLQEAQDLINRAVRIEPNNYAFLDSLGWVYYRLNRLDEAERQLTHSLQLMAKDPTIHDHLGDVYFKEGKLKEAINQWQSSLKAWSASSPADVEPEEVAKVQKKLDGARVRLAQEQIPNRNN